MRPTAGSPSYQSSSKPQRWPLGGVERPGRAALRAIDASARPPLLVTTQGGHAQDRQVSIAIMLLSLYPTAYSQQSKSKKKRSDKPEDDAQEFAGPTYMLD